MVRLPHFAQLPHLKIEPIYNLCEVDLFTDGFSEIEHNITKVKKNSIYFNLNVTSDGSIDVLDFISQSISNKEIFNIVEFKFLNKTGGVIFRIMIENFRFTKIVNLLDFNYYYSDKLKQLKVKFKYDKSEIVYEKDYKKYIKRKKLENI